jgi:hypothetical protein
MRYLHRKFKVKRGTHIKVKFSQAAKVLLLSDFQYDRYKNHFTYKYRGGFMSDSPFEFITPDNGIWHVVIEKGGYYNPLSIRGSVEIVNHNV